MKHISNGEFGVYGVNPSDEIWYRKGITNTNPIGTNWEKIDGLLKQLSIGKYGLWGINKKMKFFIEQIFLLKILKETVGFMFIKVTLNIYL